MYTRGIKQFSCSVLAFAFAILALLAPTRSFAQESQYVLGADDVITITVVRQPQFSGDYLIPFGGEVDLPVAGRMKLAGLTLQEVSSQYTEKLKVRILKPEVVVTLKIPRVQQIHVMGVVGSPGSYAWKPSYRLTEALSAAGGARPDIQTSDATVTVRRFGTDERLTFSLADVLSGDVAKNVVVNPGDVVALETIELVPIYVMGSVKAPGLYRLRKDSAGVLEALAIAGGVLDTANTSNVKVVHLNGQEEVINLTPALLGGEKVSSPRLSAGDLVVVSESTDRVAILGYVGKPGFYPMRPGKAIFLSDAIAMAEGADRRGRTSRIAVVRMENGKEQRMVYDLGKFFAAGDAKQNPQIRPGDVVFVPETNKIEWTTIISSLTTAGLLWRSFGN